MQLCVNCVLPETFPGIKFDSAGVCNHCNSYKGEASVNKQKAKYLEKFERLWNERPRDRAYDCLVCYSGGKDSSYTLDLMVRKYGARALAVTIDNAFVSPRAIENIRAVVEEAGADHLMVKPNFHVLKRMFAVCAERPIFPPKTLERASTICTACMAIVKFVSLQTAIEKRIPFIVSGWSPGQAPISSSVFKNNPSMIRKMQEALRAPLGKSVGEDITPYFLSEEHFETPERFPYNINPLAFLNYSEADILAHIQTLGWKKPEDTDANSTNCLLNSYANAVHKNQFGYNPYAFELAKLVREGAMERADAVERLEAPESDEIVDWVEERLGLKGTSHR